MKKICWLFLCVVLLAPPAYAQGASTIMGQLWGTYVSDGTEHITAQMHTINTTPKDLDLWIDHSRKDILLMLVAHKRTEGVLFLRDDNKFGWNVFVRTSRSTRLKQKTGQFDMPASNTALSYEDVTHILGDTPSEYVYSFSDPRTTPSIHVGDVRGMYQIRADSADSTDTTYRLFYIRSILGPTGKNYYAIHAIAYFDTAHMLYKVVLHGETRIIDSCWRSSEIEFRLVDGDTITKATHITNMTHSFQKEMRLTKTMLQEN